MKKIGFLLLGLVLSLNTNTSWSQTNEILVNGIKLGTYPEYTGKIWVRDPEGIDTARLSFFDGDHKLKATVSDPKLSKDKPNNKSVLFVVLNHQAHRDRTRWYQEVLNQALDKGMLKDGDEFAVVSFDCNRPEYGSVDKQLLFPKSPVFTSDRAIIESQIYNIDLTKRLHRDNCRTKGDIYGAIQEALKQMDAHSSTKSKSIVVLADDLAEVKNGGERGEIINRARKINIPVYGITYYQNIKGDYGIKDICKETYGEYEIDESNRVGVMSSKLLEFMNSQIERASGLVYGLSFTSAHEKDGKTYSVRVQYGAESSATGFQYHVPEKTKGEWISENKLLFTILVLSGLILIIVIVVLIRKQKRKRLEAEQLQNEKLARVKSQQEEAESKVAQQDLELQKIKEAEQAKIQAEKDAKLKKEKEESNALKLQEMGARGNLPWFTFNFQGSSGSIEMNAPDFSFGRGKDVNYTINHKTVSRNHFIVSYENGSYSIQDLGSSNGTYLNGQKISKSKISHGDIIGAGEILLTFHI